MEQHRLTGKIRGPATLALVFFLAHGLAACGGGDGPTAPELLDVSGTWVGTGTDESGPGSITFNLSQQGSQVSGTFTAVDDASGLEANGTIDGEITEHNAFVGVMDGSFPAIGCSLSLDFEADVEDDTMSGTYSGQGCQERIDDGRFTLTRQ